MSTFGTERTHELPDTNFTYDSDEDHWLVPSPNSTSSPLSTPPNFDYEISPGSDIEIDPITLPPYQFPDPSSSTQPFIQILSTIPTSTMNANPVANLSPLHNL